MIKCVIIEDSRLARVELKELLKPFLNINLIAEADNIQTAKEVILNTNPDLIFLDIHLQDKNGFELLEVLDSIPAVIFTTAYDKYAIRAFEYNTIDYLLKPISSDRLEQAINKIEERFINAKAASSNILTETEQVFIKDRDKCWFVKIEDIYLLESKGNYTRVFFKKNKPMVLKSLQHYEKILDENIFFRVNRRQIINLKYVDEVISWFNGRLKLRLISGDEIEVSRRQTDKIKELFSF